GWLREGPRLGAEEHPWMLRARIRLRQLEVVTLVDESSEARPRQQRLEIFVTHRPGGRNCGVDARCRRCERGARCNDPLAAVAHRPEQYSGTAAGFAGGPLPRH